MSPSFQTFCEALTVSRRSRSDACSAQTEISHPRTKLMIAVAVKGAAPALDAKGVRKLIQDGSADYKKKKKEEQKTTVDDFVKGALKPSKGQTLVTTVFPTGGGTRNSVDLIYLTDKANKKILVYKMEKDKLTFVAARKYEYDEKIPLSANYNQFVSYLEVKKAWMKQQEEDKKKEEREKR